MNVERLQELIEALLSDEEVYAVQSQLQGLANALSNLVNEPQAQNWQIEVSNAFDTLIKSVTNLYDKYDPADIDVLGKIGGLKFFSPAMVAEIQSLIMSNQITPAVVRDKVNSILSERQQFLGHLQGIREGLRVLNIKEESFEKSAEIGFQIPRNIFANEFEGLISELRVIRLIIRAFSEAATGSSEPIELHQISTSDPLFVFGLKLATIRLLGKAVHWALDTWKKVEEIREIRARVAVLESFTADDVGFFERKIEDQIKSAIQQEAAILVPSTGEGGREFERRTHMENALRNLLERIERGMKVEIKLLEHKDGEDEVDAESRSDIEQTIKGLNFPPVKDAPVLPLTTLPDVDTTDV